MSGARLFNKWMIAAHPDPNVTCMIELHKACLILHELRFHAYHLHLMNHLEEVSQLITLFQAENTGALLLKFVIVTAKCLIVVGVLALVLLRIVAAPLYNRLKGHFERLAKTYAALRHYLYQVDTLPEGVLVAVKGTDVPVREHLNMLALVAKLSKQCLFPVKLRLSMAITVHGDGLAVSRRSEVRLGVGAFPG